ncbi:MAG: hypothetical protein ACO32I_07020 [Candidatus Limnocylindrus sp.]
MALPPIPFGAQMDLPLPAAQPELEGVDVSVPEVNDFEGGVEIIEQPDGSVILREPMDEGIGEVPHTANLAEYMDEDELQRISTELRASYQDDIMSRKEWEEAYTNGLNLLGIKHEERSEPFEGASGVTHPLISESVTQFQAQAYKELLPSGGPVKTQILGAVTKEREEQAQRVKEFMNYQTTEVMEEYDPDMDQLLFYLPLSGSAFKKVYFDESLQRAVSKFIPAQDLVVPYSATDLLTSPRVTHVLRMDENDLRKMQVAGFYRDIDLTPDGNEKRDQVREKVDDIQGTTPSTQDTTFVLLEMHVALDLQDFPDLSPAGEPTGIKLPYIVTIDELSGEILSIRRNFDEGVELARKKQYFVHYKFLPGLGFYGFGLIHMIGNLGRASTSILRQLIDAGTLSNLPGGFKAKGMRLRDNDSPIQPGEWRDVDVPGGDLRNSLMPLPYKEPSATLAQLLGALVEAGRRFISLADERVSNMNQEMPVGTTVALLERGMKVMSAIHKRLHYAQRQEFKILARIFAESLPQEYPYEVAGGDRTIKASDFDGRIDVIPVSDPNIFSMSQRIALAQTQLQLAQSNPDIHNLHAAYRRMYQALEVQNIDELLPPPPQPQPVDAVVENGKALAGSLLQAFEGQNHDAHIEIHIMALQLPLVQASPPVMGVLISHIMEHVSLLAREQAVVEVQGLIAQTQMMAQTGAVDPVQAQQQIMQVQQQMQNPEELEKLVAMQQLALLQKVMARMMPPPADPMQDPLVQIRMKEVGLKEQDILRKAQADVADNMMEEKRIQQQALSTLARIESQEQIADDRNAVNLTRIDMQRQNMMMRNNNAPPRR